MRLNDELSFKRVIVVGFPKSGNTWITRLVGSLIDAPVIGFLDEPENPEIAIEGQGRQSKFEIYKAHQTYSALLPHLVNSKIIYVVRDPRDVVVSGFNYFTFDSLDGIGKMLRRIPVLKRVVSKILRSNKKRRRQMMLDAVLRGLPDYPWLETPWHEHVQPFLESDATIIRYEDMLEEPIVQSTRIVSALGLHRNEDQIRVAIEQQSFKTVKKKFETNSKVFEAQFLRTGASGGWREVLTQSEQLQFYGLTIDVMKKLDYAK